MVPALTVATASPLLSGGGGGLGDDSAGLKTYISLPPCTGPTLSNAASGVLARVLVTINFPANCRAAIGRRNSPSVPDGTGDGTGAGTSSTAVPNGVAQSWWPPLSIPPIRGCVLRGARSAVSRVPKVESLSAAGSHFLSPLGQGPLHGMVALWALLYFVHRLCENTGSPAPGSATPPRFHEPGVIPVGTGQVSKPLPCSDGPEIRFSHILVPPWRGPLRTGGGGTALCPTADIPRPWNLLPQQLGGA